MAKIRRVLKRELVEEKTVDGLAQRTYKRTWGEVEVAPAPKAKPAPKKAAPKAKGAAKKAAPKAKGATKGAKS